MNVNEMRTLCATILAAGVVAMVEGGLRAAVVEVVPCNGNATPTVVSAAARLCDGDTLRFAHGEYHFHADSAKSQFLSSPDARIAGLSLAHNDPAFLEECLKAMWEDVKLFEP